MMRLVSTLALGAALSLSVLATTVDAQQQQQRRGAQPPALQTGLSKAFADAYNSVLTLARANNLAGAKEAYQKLAPTNDTERNAAGAIGVALGQQLNDAAMVSR